MARPGWLISAGARLSREGARLSARVSLVPELLLVEEAVVGPGHPMLLDVGQHLSGGETERSYISTSFVFSTWYGSYAAGARR